MSMKLNFGLTCLSCCLMNIDSDSSVNLKGSNSDRCFWISPSLVPLSFNTSLLLCYFDLGSKVCGNYIFHFFHIENSGGFIFLRLFQDLWRLFLTHKAVSVLLHNDMQWWLCFGRETISDVDFDFDRTAHSRAWRGFSGFSYDARSWGKALMQLLSSTRQILTSISLIEQHRHSSHLERKRKAMPFMQLCTRTGFQISRFPTCSYRNNDYIKHCTVDLFSAVLVHIYGLSLVARNRLDVFLLVSQSETKQVRRSVALPKTCYWTSEWCH